MTAVISKESKSILARLLATENLIVEHKNVSTAAFDPDSRVLTLPTWKQMTDDIYDMLVGHEVAHALYSPSVSTIPNDLSKSWVNVVEDARIEKLIKRKFPGLSVNFFRGYKQLFDRNFFETQGRNLNSYSLIDRINLHFKNVPLVPFSKEETPFVEMVSACETFEDVINVVRAIRGYAEEKELEFEDIIQDFSEFSDQQGELENTQQGNREQVESKKQESQSESGDNTEEGDNNQDKQQENYYSQSNHQDRSELDESETDNAWVRNQENLLDESCRNYIYLNIPKIPLDDIIVDWKTYGQALSLEIANYEADTRNQYLISFSEYVYRYQTFKNSNMKSVNYLVKEFEMRKSADEYRRASIAKTGVIDTNMLHSYKWNEDIFKKLTVTPGAKNHGLIFFLDWSGSMDACLKNTVKQLYNLIWFCTKVQIPFEVYAFSEIDPRYNAFGKSISIEPKENDIAINNGIRLHQLFTSDMKNIQLEQQMKNFWFLIHNLYKFSAWFALGGTPLNEAIICAKPIAEKFLTKNKVQKLNFVFLTDGESNYTTRWREAPKGKYYSNETHIMVGLGGYYSEPGDKYILRDNYQTYEMDKGSNYKQTQSLLNWLKDNVDANIIGFRIANDRDANNYVYNIGHISWDTVRDEWRKQRSITLKNKGGYDEMYVIRNDLNLGADTKEISFESDASKAQIKRAFANHMKSKTFNKVILNKFIGVIA